MRNDKMNSTKNSMAMIESRVENNSHGQHGSSLVINLFKLMEFLRKTTINQKQKASLWRCMTLSDPNLQAIADRPSLSSRGVVEGISLHD